MDIVFALAPLLHSFWSYFSTDLSSNLGAYQPGEFLFQYPVILPFPTVHGVLRQEYLNGLPSPSPVEDIVSEVFTMTHPSWVALQGMAHSFTE